MSKDYLNKTVEMDCPICEKVHSVDERKRITKAIVKDEVIDYDQVFYRCNLSDEEENEFVPAGIMDENLLRARDAYREKKGLLSSEDIVEIRNSYDLSQSDFAAMLGWGDVTITRYETKTIQDETYDNMMKMVYNNPLFALENLSKHKERFSEEKYKKIRQKIKSRVEELGVTFLKKLEITSLYVNYEEESDFNGFRTLDIDKVSNVMAYFSQFIDNLYKVKLMKLLWYTDALCFSRYGKSMTGLVYKHMPLGALPIAYNEIIYLPTVKVVEEMINDDLCFRICPNKEVSISEYSFDELNVLETVAKKFKDMKSREVVDYMHKEKAYTDTEQYQVIPYSLAKHLRELK